VSRNQQLADEVAELQRQRAVEQAEIQMLSAQIQEGSLDCAGVHVDAREAAAAFAKVQDKLASLEKTRARVHEQARHSRSTIL
jgi:septal ring factor EnvC (AmiA/AmiB activator)